jgi:hypothetical protein
MSLERLEKLFLKISFRDSVAWSYEVVRICVPDVHHKLSDFVVDKAWHVSWSLNADFLRRRWASFQYSTLARKRAIQYLYLIVRPVPCQHSCIIHCLHKRKQKSAYHPYYHGPKHTRFNAERENRCEKHLLNVQQYLCIIHLKCLNETGGF